MTGARRGPARSETARLAILDATARLVVERGYEQLSIEGIAADAGVGKQTIYRWWASKAAVVAESLFERRLLAVQFAPPDTGNLRADLTLWLESLFAYVEAPESAALFRSLAAAAAADASIGEGLRGALAAGEELTGRLERAVEAGEIAASASPELIVEAIVGTVILRIITRAPAQPGHAGHLIKALLG